MGLGGVDPGVDSNVQGKDHGSDTNHSESNIEGLSLPGLGTGFVMEQGWENETEGHTSYASDERYKDIQGRATNSKGNKGADQNQEGADSVLLHLDLEAAAARLFTPPGVLNDLRGWRQHKRDREDDGTRVEDLDSDGHAAGDGEVHEDNGLDIAAKGRVAEGAHAGENTGYDSHGDSKDARELFGLGHGLGDRNDYWSRTRYWQGVSE